MNKKTGEFSAADLKKPCGKKTEPKSLGPGRNNSPAVPGRFICRDCNLNLPDSEITRKTSVASWCGTCVAKLDAITSGTWRRNRAKFESATRNDAKAAAKNYRAGKLPKWMYS